MRANLRVKLLIVIQKSLVKNRCFLSSIDLLISFKVVSYVMDSIRVSLNSLLIIFLLSVNKNLDKSKNWLTAITFCKLIHGALDQVESLLEIIKADNRINAIPV